VQTMRELSRRVSRISPSATLAITTKAKAMRAQGLDVISFGAGEPDFPTPEYIVRAAEAACREPSNHKYSPAAGLPALRQAIARKTARDSGLEVSPDRVLVTNGGKHAVFNALQTLLNPGDEVLLPTPHWVTYPEAIALAGGVTIQVATDESTGFRVSTEMLEEATSERTKALIFVSPSNPTGSVYPASDVKKIGEWAAERDIWVITDEIYEHLVYGDNDFSSIPVLTPEVRDRCIVLNGVSKAYSMTGWRVGWMIGSRDVVRAAVNLQSHSTSNVANVAQAAALEAVEGPLDSVFEMREAFDRRRRTMHRLLGEMPNVTSIESQGAFYEFPSFTAVLGHEIAGRIPTTTLELAEIILDEARVAFVPGEAFGAAGYGRFSYALADADLATGLERIGELLSSI
jgi:aspartate aminotransferase